MAITRLHDSLDPANELRGYNTQPSEWRAGAGAFFPIHRHAETKYLYVASGSIRFGDLELHSGQGIRIDAGTDHSAVAGPDGVICVEGFSER